jgi:hypothetical protein
MEILMLCAGMESELNEKIFAAFQSRYCNKFAPVYLLSRTTKPGLDLLYWAARHVVTVHHFSFAVSLNMQKPGRINQHCPAVELCHGMGLRLRNLGDDTFFKNLNSNKHQ